MKIHFLRNASMIVYAGNEAILVDPMLADKGELPPYAYIRHKAVRNPLVPLPENASIGLEDVTAALVTHFQRGHSDHLDRKGARFIRTRNIQVYCGDRDAKILNKKGIRAHPLKIKRKQPFLNGYITPIPTRHGYGWIASLMGPGLGFVIELPEEPSLYISGDTVLTDDVRETLLSFKPDIAIVAAGQGRLDIGKNVLMTLDDVMEFTALAPGVVVANHLEAVNICPGTRQQIAEAAQARGFADKIKIPFDGEILNFK